MKSSTDRRRRGFTLIEVLVSLALVGAILPAAMAGISLAMGLGVTARQRTEAAILARSKLAEMMATGDWQSSATRGDFGDEWPQYSWQVAVSEWEEPQVSEVALTVTWKARGQTRSVVMTTLGYAGSE